jgi:two-component system, NarL family, nitrate/nitrite response regulator NarL
MSRTIRVALVDDHLIFRTGVIQILKNDPAIEIVGEGSTAASACELAELVKPDILLLDIHVHGSGIDMIPKIKHASPATKVVMLTASESESKLQMAFEAGASGYVLKGTDGAELVRALHTIIAGETYITPTLAAILTTISKTRHSHAENAFNLTSRELEIGRSVALGKTNKEIARELLLTEKTVKHHMTQIMSKLCVRNRVELTLHFVSKTASNDRFGSLTKD